MIPLSVPNLVGNEWMYIKDCLDTNWVSSVGSYVTLFEQKIAKFCGVKHAVATSNGTAALHISLLLAGVKRGDLVLLPNITFVAPANVIKYVGADPVLIDIDAATWQMDLDILEDFLKHEAFIQQGKCIHKKSGRQIRAIVPVHVLGNICDMGRLLYLAETYQLTVVEDSTEALGSYYRGEHAGSFGRLGCLSFNGNKIITTGGGGMILCNDDELAHRAKHLTTQAKATTSEYYHDEVGYNYRLVNILAAMGVAQMELLPSFLEKKALIATRYNELFENLPGAALQKSIQGVQPNNWLYTVKLPDCEQLRTHLQNAKVEVRPFWVPMNQLPAFHNDLYVHNHDVSDSIYKSCLSLPCSTGLLPADQEQVIQLIKSYFYD